MTENTGFAAFALYNALKLHFTSDSYDYFKYNGKTNVSRDSFANRKDKYSFYKLSRKFNLDELKGYYVANFLEHNDKWIGDMAGPVGEENYRKWQKRIHSLTYTFENDIVKLLDSVISPEELLSVNSGSYPKLLLQSMEENVGLETLIIMDDIMNFFPMWTKKIDDDIIWPTFKRTCEKYKPFLLYDKAKYTDIMKKRLKEHG
jgi:hypothetical protein